MRRALLTIAICTLVLGCEIRKRRPEDAPSAKDPATGTPSMPATTLTPEQIGELRAAVIAGSTLLEHPELTPTDPAIVDRFVIGALYEGKYPVTASERENYLWGATTRLTNWLSFEEHGLAYLTKRVAERYAHPVITRDAYTVKIDAGVVPGRLSVFRARLQVMESPLLDRGELIAAEVVRFLQLGMIQHPDASTYELEIYIPASGSQPRWFYVYDRGQDVVRVDSRNWWNEHYVTAKLGGKLDSVTSLYHTSLIQQSGSRR